MRLSDAGTTMPVDLMSAARQLGACIATRSELEELLPGTEWGNVLFGRTSPILVGSLWPGGPEARVLSPLMPEVWWVGWVLGDMVCAQTAPDLVDRMKGSAAAVLAAYAASSAAGSPS